MPIDLPPTPSLEQLKKQAKDLRRACRDGQAAALARACQYLPRLGGAQAAEATGISLQECQHVVAVEYGFKDWKVLAAAVGASFADLVRLSGHDAQVLMRQVDQKDLVTALKEADTGVKETFLRNMSARVRGFIESEITLAPTDKTAGAQTQQRIMRQILDLSRQGLISWGAKGQDTEPLNSVQVEADFFALVGRPLDQLTVEEMASLWRQVAQQARSEGILSLQQFEGKLSSPLLREALQLTVDGTEPDVIEDLLKIRSRTLLRQLETRAQMVDEGLLAIMAGDNPGLIAHKLSAFYAEDTQGVKRPDSVTAAQLVDHLRQLAPSALDFAGFNALLTDMAHVSRRDGIAALEPLVAALEIYTDAESELLRRGLEMMLAKEEWGRFLEALGTLGKARHAGLAAAHRMVIAGVGMVQAGRKPEDIAAQVRRVGLAEEG
jgi:hypothetical protein